VRPDNNPIVAICGTRRAAAEAAEVIRRAGLPLRKLSIVESEYPSDGAAAKIKEWPALSSSWVTAGCLNAIGGGLESLGITDGDMRRCRAALRGKRILVVVQGTLDEVALARRAVNASKFTDFGGNVS